MEKGNDAGKPVFSPYPTMFSNLPKTNLNFSVKVISTSANDFSLDKSRILSFGKDITVLHGCQRVVLLVESHSLPVCDKISLWL